MTTTTATRVPDFLDVIQQESDAMIEAYPSLVVEWQTKIKKIKENAKKSCPFSVDYNLQYRQHVGVQN